MRSVPRWGGPAAGSAALATAGVASGEQVLLAAAVVPLVFVCYGALATTPPAESVRVERSVRPDAPMPGETVRVDLTVTNPTDRPLPDVRVVDGVPDPLRVVAGTPRGGFALRPGESTTLSYSVVARRGEYAFDAPSVRTRNVSGTRYDTTAIPVAGAARITCEVGVDEVPLHEQTTGVTGQLPTDTGGSGVEFYATREYRTGDPPSRIDWRHLAKSGSLTTIDYRRQQAARIVVVLDARAASDVARRSGSPTGVDLGVYAAARLVGTLADADHQVGVATVEDGEAGPRIAWVEPSSGPELRARAERLFDSVLDAPAEERSVADGGGAPGDGAASDALTELRQRLGGDAQVLFVSPFADDYPAEVTRTLSAHGHAVTVVSPDVTGADTTGRRMAAVEREVRLADVRDRGIPVNDWHPDAPLATALADALEGVR
ncbi:DUF58 domain-containing protein [Halostella sp. JP-L12]|uniref:DUF58 domain-containing protein n=1 Tax=Halostella TaxID=1843185 RepID=UPI000EF7F4E3|nr:MULTISPECIES: DUF58 domain-containing protein [Halostella]NHN48300.1 DUF58 domain-containing protein [Halostella sp. JP-L12]